MKQGYDSLQLVSKECIAFQYKELYRSHFLNSPVKKVKLPNNDYPSILGWTCLRFFYFLLFLYEQKNQTIRISLPTEK